MKPSDRPDFFRLPPPPGRSRESTIKLDRFGRFFHDGEPVQHDGLAGGFARWVARHPDNGRYILSNGHDWCYFTVEATPYFVRGLRVIDGGAQLTLSDQTKELLNPKGACIDDDGVVRVSVKGGAFQARFTQAAQLELAPLLADEEPCALVVAGTRYVLTATKQESPDAE